MENTEQFRALGYDQVGEANDGLVLLVDDNGKAWVHVIGSDTFTPLMRDGKHDDLKFGDWVFSAIGRDAQGNIRVLDANPKSGENYGWVVDESGAIRDAELFDRHNADVGEPIFNKDLDGDGVILSGPLELVAQNDGLSLFVDSGSGFAYYRVEDGGLVPILRDGENDTLLTRGDWSLAGIGRDADGNIRVLDHNPATDTSWGWIIGKDGKWNGENQYPNSGNGEAEKIFQKDLNGDGHIPALDQRTIDVNGDLRLVVDRDSGLAMITLEDGEQLTITRGGEGVPLARGEYQLIAVGRDAEGRLRVLDSRNEDSDHYAWILDENGQFIGEEVFTPEDLRYAERMFNQDFDGDGEIWDRHYTLIETDGNAWLAKHDYTGDAVVATEGGEVTVARDGAPVDVTRGAWNLVAATVDDQGRMRVLDTHPDSYELYAWILDDEGHFIGEDVFNRGDIGAAETLFEIDLDGDGVIGRPTVSAGHDDWAYA